MQSKPVTTHQLYPCSIPMNQPTSTPRPVSDSENAASLLVLNREQTRRGLIVRVPIPLLPFKNKSTQPTLRNDYKLGDVARSSSHMIRVQSYEEAIRRISMLKTFDFAFVKRSNGSWTYGILAMKSYDGSDEDSMMFVLNYQGANKTIERRQWADCIRCVAHESEGVDMQDSSSRQREFPGSIPNSIAFIPNGLKEKRSLVWNASMRLRLLVHMNINNFNKNLAPNFYFLPWRESSYEYWYYSINWRT